MGFEATPTEYKGVRFRSRSEAVFAFHVEQARWWWHYEHSLASDIHQWDFLLRGQDWSRTIFVEYKPVKPTSCYVSNLVAKIGNHFSTRLSSIYQSKPGIHDDSLRCLFRDMQSRFILVWGSPWSPAVVKQESRWEDWPTQDFVHLQDKSTTYSAFDLFPESFGEPIHPCNGHENKCLSDLGITDEITSMAKLYRFDLPDSIQADAIPTDEQIAQVESVIRETRIRQGLDPQTGRRAAGGSAGGIK